MIKNLARTKQIYLSGKLDERISKPHLVVQRYPNQHRPVIREPGARLIRLTVDVVVQPYAHRLVSCTIRVSATILNKPLSMLDFLQLGLR